MTQWSGCSTLRPHPSRSRSRVLRRHRAGQLNDRSAQLAGHRAVAELAEGIGQSLVVPELVLAGRVEPREHIVSRAQVEQDGAGVVQLVGKRYAERAGR